MKIKAVKMKHFGKFTDKELEFGNGLNIIEGDNEAGKSTLHAFIRGMFFGIEKTRGRAGKNDIYSRYLPWDTPGAYQGSLDVEMGGRDIRISRVFLQNAKACSAQEIDTGKDIDLGEAGITALIDKLTPSAFDNTVSCAQQQLKSKEDFGSYIRSYIANMADSRDSRVDVSSALEVLDGKVRDITRKLKDTDEDAAQENLNSLLEDEKDESYIIADRDEARAAIADLEGKKNNVMRDIDPEALRIKHELAVRMAGKLKEADRDRAEAERYSERADDYRVRLTECENRLDARKEEFTRAAENLKDIKSELETASTGENDPETAAAAADDARIKAEESTAVLEELKTTQAGTAQKAKKLMLYGGLIAVLDLWQRFFSANGQKPAL
ncbi:MAG: AAA family ATPase [Lachnospiraceae bacterium]|nr:AAA family ATPase [Lachnospiraceae bacterium]